MLVDGNWIRYRVAGPADAPPMVHVHGFAISGSYLHAHGEPAHRPFRVYVPDLPGFGRSPARSRAWASRSWQARWTASWMLWTSGMRSSSETPSAARSRPSSIEPGIPTGSSKAVMVGLAGGRQNQPLIRAVGQMVRDGLVEPPAMIAVAGPDYFGFGPLRAMRLFEQMTQFPAYERFMSIRVPTMVVIGSEDPLRPSWQRIRRALSKCRRR